MIGEASWGTAESDKDETEIVEEPCEVLTEEVKVGRPSIIATLFWAFGIFIIGLTVYSLIFWKGGATTMDVHDSLLIFAAFSMACMHEETTSSPPSLREIVATAPKGKFCTHCEKLILKEAKFCEHRKKIGNDLMRARIPRTYRIGQFLCEFSHTRALICYAFKMSTA